MSSKLSAKITTKQSYIIGEEVTVFIDISNCGRQAVYLHQPITQSGLLRYNLFSVKKDEVEISYHGMYFRSYESDRIYLEPQNNFKFNISLAKEYLLDDSGIYNLTIRNSALLCSNVDEVVMPNTAISFNISLGVELPVITHAQAAQRMLKGAIKSKTFGNIHKVYNSMDDNEVRAVQDAHNGAVKALTNIKELSYPWPLSIIFGPKYPQAYSKYYETMFCKDNSNDWRTVINEYKLMFNYMQDDMQYWLRAPGCTSLSYGYIFPANNDKSVYLCPLYDKASTLPDTKNKYDSKAGVILHEVSHKAAHTKDHFYTYHECEVKANICEKSTVTNADCIQMFAELVYVHKVMNPHDEI